MSDDQQLELYKSHRAAQDKYDFFLLAAAGAAIGFALTQTKSSSLAVTQAPLGLAVLLWGLSFYLGCQHLLGVHATMWTNSQLLEVKAGRHPLSGRNPQLVVASVEIINEMLEKQGNRTGRLARWQFTTLILGAVSYIVWHVLEMYLRTTAAT